MSDMKSIKDKLMGMSKGNLITTVGQDPEKDWYGGPALDLNRILSGSLYKSVQSGNHTIFVGPEASGKSSLMALLARDAQQKGVLPFVFNIEGAWNTPFVTRWGLDPDNVLLFPGNFVEDVTLQCTKMLDEKVSDVIIILDSIGALESRKMITDAAKNDIKADQGGLAKKIKRLLKILVALIKFNENVTVLSAGHTYKNPNSYGSGEEIGGGGYLKLSADTLVSLKKTPIYEFPEKEKKADKGKILGNRITAVTLKNRQYPPFQEAVVEIDFKNGVNASAGIVDVGMDIGVIKKSGAWYSCPSLGINNVQGEKNFYDVFNNTDTTEFYSSLEDTLLRTGYSSLNKEVALEHDEVISADEKSTKKKTEAKKKKGNKNE